MRSATTVIGGSNVLTNEVNHHASVGEAWIACMRDVLRDGRAIHDGQERLLETLNYNTSMSVVPLEDDPILSAGADLGRIAFMREKYSSCGILPPYNISYGALLYANNGVDQIDWVRRRLEANPDSKSATIGLHHPGDEDLSCLSLLDYKIRDSKLSCTAIYRSQNVFSSQPGNIIALHDVQTGLAGELGVGVGDFCISALSAHIYLPDVDAARTVVDRFS